MKLNLADRPILVNILCIALFGVIAMSVLLAGPLQGSLGDVFAHRGSSVELFLLRCATMWPWVGRALTVGLLLVNSFYITRLTIRSVVYLSHSFMPALFLMCFGFSSFSTIYSFVPLLSVLMVLLSVDGMTGSFTVKGLASGRWFLVGVYVALAGIFYLPCTLFLVMLPLGLLLFRGFDLREWVAAFGGYALMLFYCAFADYFAMGGDFIDTFWVIAAFWGDILFMGGVMEFVDGYSVVDWVLLGGCVLAAFISIIAFWLRGVVYIPLELRTFDFLILMLVVLSAFVLVSGVSMASFLPLFAVALAFVLPPYFVNHGKTLLANLLLLIIVAASLWKGLSTRLVTDFVDYLTGI